MSDEGELCQDCGQRYLTVYSLPDHVWSLITPKPDAPGAGLLCPSCADRRARERGIELYWGAQSTGDLDERPDDGSEYGRLLAQRDRLMAEGDRLIAEGINPDELDVPLVLLPPDATLSREGIEAIRKRDAEWDVGSTFALNSECRDIGEDRHDLLAHLDAIIDLHSCDLPDDHLGRSRCWYESGTDDD